MLSTFSSAGWGRGGYKLGTRHTHVVLYKSRPRGEGSFYFTSWREGAGDGVFVLYVLITLPEEREAQEGGGCLRACTAVGEMEACVEDGKEEVGRAD
jgi:hypothetical protein